ncbi:MAG: DUF3524 domain-containing protein [Desulfobacterales bacterium]|nr:DUF3524 domain-containing protein [Desulfobacterales bacterium]
MKILFLEPFYGGSHKDFALGLTEYSEHEIEILTLPPRFWKWRMRGASLHFIRQIPDISAYDLIFATDMMDLTDFKGLAGRKCPPVVFYFHENQLSYPLGPHEKRDFHLGFTNVISAFAADAVIFNSKFHRDDFFKAARTLVKQMPDNRPLWMLDAIKEKTSVLYPGCRYPADLAPVIGASDLDRPLVIWNHRWEYDKNPDLFFRVLGRLKKKGVLFYLALLGEQYEIIPKVFDRAKEEFKDEILVEGFRESAAEYRAWLDRGRVVVSTAIQENFGISVMEAVARGCFPVLPNRLSYPELVPLTCHKDVIYNSEKGLESRLEKVLTNPDAFDPACRDLAAHAAGFSWESLVRQYDGLMERIAAPVKN